MLNLVVTQGNPLAVNGVFLSPFSRLTYAEKANVFELIEGPESSLIGLLDAQFPEQFYGDYPRAYLGCLTTTKAPTATSTTSTTGFPSRTRK